MSKNKILKKRKIEEYDESEYDESESDNYDYKKYDELITKYNKQIKIIKDKCYEETVTIDKVIESNFSDTDICWFYKNLENVKLLEGKDKFDLMEKIEKKYRLLKVLKENNLYDNILLNEDIVSNIINSKHTNATKKILLNKLLSIKDISDDYYKCVEWINTVLFLPTEINNNKKDTKTLIKNLHDNLHKNLYGMDKTIKHILQAVSAILNNTSKGSILTLVGQSGVGKTTISSLISQSIGMGFGQISCGNINDISTLIGHSSTYIGAKTGLFTQIQINNKQMDNVVLLDEMDKITDTKITPILLHVLDFSQNNRFKDAYCPEIDIDLSKNLYIISVNSIDKFDSALLDRMKIIHVDGYDLEQKCEICIKHIIPKSIERTGINKTIDKNVLKKYLSPNKTGIRDVERFIENIYEKLLLATHLGNSYIGLPDRYKVIEKGKIDENIINILV